MNPVMLVQLSRKLLPHLEKDEWQGFPNEEIRKSEIPDMVYAMRRFENTDKDNIEEWLPSDDCELSFQQMTDKDTADIATKQKGEEGGEDESEEGESSKNVSYSMALQCVDTLLDYVGQRQFKYCDITAARKIHLP
jgi:hypothetical protein